MSLEQLKAFLAKVKGDSNLQEKLKSARSAEDVVGIAKEHGHEFTADKISQLSEEELEGVSGVVPFVLRRVILHFELTHIRNLKPMQLQGAFIA